MLLEWPCTLMGQGMLMGGWWEQAGVVLTEPREDSNVMMQCPPQGWGSRGDEEGRPEDGCPSSTGSAAALAMSSLANPDGQHWPPRNPRPRWVDNSIRERAAGSEYQPQPLPYQEGFQTPKTSHQRHARLKRRHAKEDTQAGWARGATYLRRDEPLDQLPDKGGQVRVLHPALLWQTSLWSSWPGGSSCVNPDSALYRRLCLKQ